MKREKQLEKQPTKENNELSLGVEMILYSILAMLMTIFLFFFSRATGNNYDPKLFILSFLECYIVFILYYFGREIKGYFTFNLKPNLSKLKSKIRGKLK